MELVGRLEDAAFFLASFAQIYYGLKESTSWDTYKVRLDGMRPQLAAAMDWLSSQSDMLAYYDSESSNRLLVDAVAFILNGQILNDPDLIATGNEFLDQALDLVQPDGVEMESGWGQHINDIDVTSHRSHHRIEAREGLAIRVGRHLRGPFDILVANRDEASARYLIGKRSDVLAGDLAAPHEREIHCLHRFTTSAALLNAMASIQLGSCNVPRRDRRMTSRCRDRLRRARGCGPVDRIQKLGNPLPIEIGLGVRESCRTHPGGEREIGQYGDNRRCKRFRRALRNEQTGCAG